MKALKICAIASSGSSTSSLLQANFGILWRPCQIAGLVLGVHDCARASGTKSRIVVHVGVLDVAVDNAAVLAAVDEHATPDNCAIRVNKRGLVHTKVCRGNR